MKILFLTDNEKYSGKTHVLLLCQNIILKAVKTLMPIWKDATASKNSINSFSTPVPKYGL